MGSTKIAQVSSSLYAVPLSEVLSDAKHGDHTHFELLIAPCILDVRTNSAQVADDDASAWCHAHTPPDVGFAAPMKRLLNSLATEI